jgi:uncharacterized membrane protein
LYVSATSGIRTVTFQEDTVAKFSLFTAAGPDALFAWFHFLSGVTWIGILYYFNFVQVPFMAEADAATKPGVTTKLLPRALWWFRWGAVVTVGTGLLIIGYKISQAGGGIMKTSWGVGISIGALLGIVMFLNVWLIIWPNQKKVIASAVAVAGGGAADPAAAPAAARAFLASRTNALFSIPMLFFMGNHRLVFFGAEPAMSVGVPMGICTLLIVLFELNALVGKKGEGPAKMLEKHVGVIHVGLVLTLIMYFVVDGLL